ncbi:MAG: RdgB/HAM1 family non-canonical purine NTP pyrophosphatase [Candidatus Gastranaerophilales bacterium]|nr:RdgB/HAM1 family non-canonical purine NTP pyrophosphatase [Candidatus Gastranaerophilales bacterium]MBR6583637.1 RdgB/HAM1 family non-canonical purine NTP pyrophosphatase [Treponema sp.]
MKIYLATSNQNKKREIQEIFSQHEIRTPADDGIEFDPEETGTTFYENSLIKAKALYEIVKCPVIADDSGICVDALNGAPGIYSSRYAGPEFMKGKPDGSKISQEEQNLHLINQLNEAIKQKNLPKMPYLNGERSCHYTCAMVLYLGPDRLFVAQETFEGTIIDSIEKQAGNGGFGYDPIVFLPQQNKTIAQLTADEKHAISHRGKAVRALQKIIEKL